MDADNNKPKMKTLKTKPTIIIRENNCATNDPCAICGQRTDPNGLFDFFLEGTVSLVCDQCVEKYDPALKVLYLAGYDAAAAALLKHSNTP
jgi:hypothetical protein